MTATDSRPSAELEPVLAGALRLLSDKPEAPLDLLAAAVVPEVSASAVEAPGFPELPKHVELDEKAREALRRLHALFGQTEIEVRRSLTSQELRLITAEAEVIKDLAPALKARLEAISEIIRVHMDVEAEQAGTVRAQPVLNPDDGSVELEATPRDQNGHYLQAKPKQPHEVQVGNRVWSQQYSASAAAPSDALVHELFLGETITRQEYLAVTAEQRSLDTLKLLAFIRKHPARGLEILRLITRRTGAKSSLYLRNVK